MDHSYEDTAGNITRNLTPRQAMKMLHDDRYEGRVIPPAEPAAQEPQPAIITPDVEKNANEKRCLVKGSEHGPTIAQQAKTRCEDQIKWAKDNGFAIKSTFSVAGKVIEQNAEERVWTQRKSSHNAKAKIENACRTIAEKIALEGRWQEFADIADIKFDGDKMVLPSGRRITLEHGFLNSWARYDSQDTAPDGAKVKLSPPAAYIRHSTAEEIAQCFEIRKKYGEFTVISGRRRGLPQQMQILGRTIDGEETAYACASETYKYFGGDEYLKTIAREMEDKGFRGAVRYNQETTRISGDCAAMPEKIIGRAEGDIFSVGFKFSTADQVMSGSSFKFNPFFKRDQCDNQAMVATVMLKGIKQKRHRGNRECDKIRTSIRENIAAPQHLFEEFLQTWGLLNTVDAGEVYNLDHYHGDDLPVLQIIKQMTTKGERYGLMKNLPPEISRDVLVEMLFQSAVETNDENNSSRSVLQEPTLQDVINLVTRCHDKVPVFAEWNRPSVVDHLDARAGELIQDFRAFA